MKKSFLEANARRRTPKGFGIDAAELFQQGFGDGAVWLKRQIKRALKSARAHPMYSDALGLKVIDRVLRNTR